jgi:pyruvate kinase
VVEGGMIGEHKGVNLPQIALDLPSLTAKDRKDIEWGIEHRVDYFALSFIRKADDVLELKKILKRRRADIPVIAKIEMSEAVRNLKEIIRVSDGVMVARGDLGVEISLEKVPIIQVEIIKLCRELEKPVIVATQMLESMVKDLVPTRAEVSDVANAIFDGTDAVMLSEETSIGKNPVEAVAAMARIAEEADRKIEIPMLDKHADKSLSVAVAHAAYVLAQAVKARAIITFTETGSTALRVSKHRPEIPILGVVTSDRTARRLSLYSGVRPLRIHSFRYIDEMIVNTEKAILKNRLLKKDDLVVITAGVPINIPGTTNLIKVHKIGERHTL